jgi:hypothetical protein
MSDGFPSMTALLGLLAVAGFQNRDKIQEMLGGSKYAAPATAGGTPGQASLGGLLGNIGGGLGGAGAGTVLNSGLGPRQRSRRSRRLLGAAGAQHRAPGSAPAAGHRSGCARHAGSPDRALARRTTISAFAGASLSRGSL